MLSRLQVSGHDLAKSPPAVLKQSLRPLLDHLSAEVLGAEDVAYWLVVALLADGHLLIEGPPGVGKTSLAKSAAAAIDGSFRRIQFTPDLLPSDIVGYSMFDQSKNAFDFVPGPVFSHLVLADEINRTSPRVQSALLECMNEGQVSVDGVTHKLEKPFLVMATMNNRHAAGTFPLPTPQLDRFLLSVEMSLPTPATQVELLGKHAEVGRQVPESVVSLEDVRAWQGAVREVTVSQPIREYIVALCEAVRSERRLQPGVSARGTIAVMRVAQAVAALEGHAGVHPEDVKAAAIPALAHRLSLSGDERLVALDSKRLKVIEILEEVLASVTPE